MGTKDTFQALCLESCVEMNEKFKIVIRKLSSATENVGLSVMLFFFFAKTPASHHPLFIHSSFPVKDFTHGFTS